jgi:uncharacterized protein YndB with AHSA1/START domain
MEHIRHYVLIKAPINSVYKAITTQEGLSQWWTNQTTAKAEIGFVNEFRFGPEYFNKMRISELVSDKLVSWHCEDGDKEWIGTKLTFSLSSKDGSTILRFAHREWHEATEFYENCNFHWGLFLNSLKMLCETGKGKPFQDMN